VDTVVGGSFLLFLGVRTFRAHPADPNVPVNSSGLLRLYLYTGFPTLTNPTTIFAFIAVFATLGLGDKLSIVSASTLVIGVFIKTPRKPRSVNGDEWWFRIGFRKLPVFREAVKPRLVGGDRSHGATFFTGSGLWLLLLSSGVIFFRKKLDIVGLRWVNRIAGVLIIISGVLAIVSVLWVSFSLFRKSLIAFTEGA